MNLPLASPPFYLCPFHLQNGLCCKAGGAGCLLACSEAFLKTGTASTGVYLCVCGQRLSSNPHLWRRHITNSHGVSIHTSSVVLLQVHDCGSSAWPPVTKRKCSFLCQDTCPHAFQHPLLLLRTLPTPVSQDIIHDAQSTPSCVRHQGLCRVLVLPHGETRLPIRSTSSPISTPKCFSSHNHQTSDFVFPSLVTVQTGSHVKLLTVLTLPSFFER